MIQAAAQRAAIANLQMSDVPQPLVQKSGEPYYRRIMLNPALASVIQLVDQELHQARTH